jgi:hypothetical protein
MIFRALKKLFSGPSDKRDPQARNEAMTIHEFAESCGDIVGGYRLCVTMQPRVPLRYLRRHREFSKNIPEGEADSVNPSYIWLPVTKSWAELAGPNVDKKVMQRLRAIPESVGTMASSVGLIPEDGGTFLPFLIAIREIIERPRDRSISDYQDAIVRTDEILALSLPDSDEYLEKLYGSSKERVLEFVVGEVAEVGYDGLKLEHLGELFSQGHSSIRDMISAEDSVLLALKGVGPSRLAKIRANKKKGEQTALANP